MMVWFTASGVFGFFLGLWLGKRGAEVSLKAQEPGPSLTTNDDGPWRLP